MSFKICILGVHRRYGCHLWTYIHICIFYFQLKSWLYIVYKWFLIHLRSLWIIFWNIKPDTYYHIAFYLCIFIIKVQIPKNIMTYTFSWVHLVHDENSDDITYNHFLSLLSFSFLLTTRLWVYKESTMQEQGAIRVPLKRKDLKNKVAFSPKVTGRSGHRSSLTSTCPFLDR